MMSARALASLLAILAVASVEGLASSLTKTPTLAATTPTLLYTGLQATPLVRASDQASVVLPDLWRAQTPFGLADETAVCAFLRHFG